MTGVGFKFNGTQEKFIYINVCIVFNERADFNCIVVCKGTPGERQINAQYVQIVRALGIAGRA